MTHFVSFIELVSFASLTSMSRLLSILLQIQIKRNNKYISFYYSTYIFYVYHFVGRALPVSLLFWQKKKTPLAPVNSKFKIRFLFRQRALRTEKREQVFFLLSTSEEFELEKKFLFSTHSKSLCRGAKVMGCAHNNNLGFNFGYFSRREIVLARDIIIVSEQSPRCAK